MMIEVILQPRKQVIIHEYVKYNTAEDLVKSATLGFPPGSVIGPLNWADGVLMSFVPYPINMEITIKELMQGRVHWDQLSFALLDTCAQVRTDNATATVRDVSNHSTFKAIAKFVRENL